MDKPALEAMAKGSDRKGPRLFTTRSESNGVRTFRRMTEEEVQRWEDSKTGNTKVQPVAIDGKVP